MANNSGVENFIHIEVEKIKQGNLKRRVDIQIVGLTPPEVVDVLESMLQDIKRDHFLPIGSKKCRLCNLPDGDYFIILSMDKETQTSSLKINTPSTDFAIQRLSDTLEYLLDKQDKDKKLN